MQFSDLPGDVLRLVLEQILSGRDGVCSSFKEGVDLLAVCQRWRQLALPMVYGVIEIGCKEDVTCADGSPFSGTGEAISIRSNLGLAVSAGCLHLAKHVRIDAEYSERPNAVLDRMVGFMRAAADKWSGVKLLAVRLCTKLERDDFCYENDDDLRALCGAMAAVLPKVTRLNLCVRAPNFIIVAGKPYVLLASQYADQLEEMELNRPVRFPQDVVFRRLKKLHIDGAHEPRCRLPRMDPGVVEELRLDTLPPFEVWSAFDPDACAPEITFNNLKALDLTYYECCADRFLDDGGYLPYDDDVDNYVKLPEHTWRLRFPALKRLDMCSDADGYQLLERSELPPRMDAIAIQATSAVFRDAASRTLPAVQRLIVNILPESNNDPAALPAACRILSSAVASDDVVLMICDKKMTVAPSQINVDTLTRLSLYAPTSVDTMLDLIRKLPRLVTLTIWSLLLYDIQADINAPGPDEASLLVPFNTRIRTLTLHAPLCEPLMGSFALLVRYLILRIPTLKRLHSDRAKPPLFEAVVPAYRRQYPHLDSIRFDFKQ